VRVITNLQEISNDREDLERKANYQILSTNAVQQSSKQAKNGDYEGSRITAKIWKRKMRDNI